MTAKQLTEIGERLVKRCGTRDPFEIARQLGAEVLFCPDFGSMKGMYRVVKRNRFIFLNRDLTPQMHNNQAHGESCEPDRILSPYAAARSAICSCGVRSSNALRSRSTA